jgi:hypothetical protein
MALYMALVSVINMSKDLRISILDEDDPQQHHIKVAAILDTFFEFCGGSRYAELLMDHLEVGVFRWAMNLGAWILWSHFQGRQDHQAPHHQHNPCKERIHSNPQ